MANMFREAAAYDRWMQYTDGANNSPHGHYCPLCGRGWDCPKEDCSEPHRIKCGHCEAK